MYDFLLVVSNFNKGFGIRKLETLVYRTAWIAQSYA